MNTDTIDIAGAVTHLGAWLFCGFLILSFAWSLVERLLMWIDAALIKPGLARLLDGSKAAIGKMRRRRRGFRIVLADLSGDDDGSGATRIAAALSSIPALKVARIPAPPGWKFAGRIEMERQAEDVLRARKADVLVFGRIDRAEQVLAVSFLGRDVGGDICGLATLELPLDFDASLAPAFVATALTQIALTGEDDVPLLLDWLVPQTLELKARCERMPTSLSDPQRAGLLHAVGRSAALLGRLNHDPNAHQLALAAYRHALEGLPPDTAPLARAGTLNALAITLRHIGYEERDPALLEEAVATFAQALPYRRRDLIPFDWAETKRECGTALACLAEMDGPSRLEEAEACLREALEEYRPERTLVRWADAHIMLAHILRLRGRNAPKTAALEEAIAIGRRVVADLPQKRAPFVWAQAHTSLGHALEALAERKGDPSLLLEAGRVYAQALKEWPRSRLRLRWAATNANLGNVLATLADRTGKPDTLEDAIACYHAALKVQNRRKHAKAWASTQNSLAYALRLLGEETGNRTHLEKAVAATRAALEEWPRERFPQDWAMGQMNLGTNLCVLGQRRRNKRLIREGIAAFYRSLEERRREEMPVEWAESQGSLANGLRALGELEKSPQRLEESLSAYRAVLALHDLDTAPFDWADAQSRLAKALLARARMTRDVAEFRRAEEAFEAAAHAYRLAGAYPHEAGSVRMLEDVRARRQRLEARANSGIAGWLLPEIRHLVRRALRLGRKVVIG
ncbi:tetratricopeptide repeat protein [Afifella sp. H1R]|uniref:tetratricopeptide repeat protein n=1 Tax=Afifella sp. H1R TaxID=2908841 RepID=UPI001F269C41|nr:tetratricopeptide repeat protein [Afifella sp. H1R]